MNLVDLVVLVTGASSGIGAAISVLFAEHGAKVAMVGRNERNLKYVSEKCGNKSFVIVADVTKDNDVQRIISDTLKHFGKIDVLINNAAIVSSANILDENVMETFDRVMATNLRSVVYLTSVAVPHLIKTKGNIINISSVSAVCVSRHLFFAYETSKAALDHFTRHMALEFGPQGVRVNTINPGAVKTNIFKSAGLNETSEADIWDIASKETVLGKISEPGEIADLVLFLASVKGKSITGASYVIDNGFTLNC